MSAGCRCPRPVGTFSLHRSRLGKASCSVLRPELQHRIHKEQMPADSQLAFLAVRFQLTKAQLVDMSR